MKPLRNRNEVLVAPSPRVIRAIHSFDATKAPLYFDGYYRSELAEELTQRYKRYGVTADRISVGYGVEFFLRAIFDGCNPEKDVVLTHEPHFGFYSVYAKAKGVRLATFRMRDEGDRFVFDIDDCVKKMRAVHPKVLLITSPNNPTGNSIAPRDLEKILRATPKTTLVALDEVYWGFGATYSEKDFLKLLGRYPNLVILRSFSKRYALAGLRIGYALWGARAQNIIRYHGLYLGGSRILESIAVAALKSGRYYRELGRTIVAERERFFEEVNRSKHFRAYRSDANFVLVKVAPVAIAPLEKQLRRTPAVISKFVMPGYMRVSLGSPKDTRKFIAALRVADQIVTSRSAGR